jgi:hypothetical protein
MMTLQAFALLVATMRASQKEYFKTKSKDVLIIAKKLEQEVDRLTGELGINVTPKP